MAFINDPEELSQELTSLELEISTVDAGDAESNDLLYVNVVFADGTRLYEPFNRLVASRSAPFNRGPLPAPGGGLAKFVLPVPPGLGRTLESIAEVFLRKDGDDGWFMGSALLYANGHELPLLGNRHANQFLDNDDDVLLLREWSTRSFCVAPAAGAINPLPRSGYRILGPVLGQISDTSAGVLYRVDREGSYRFRAVDTITSAPVADVTVLLEPTRRFHLTGLQPDRRYKFDLSFVRAGVETTVPDAVGSLRTYPADGTPGRFSFAFGSCANPDKQVAQGSWTAIRALAEAPPPGIDPVRLFVHLGDSFYFYDDMTEEKVRNVESMQAAHLSMRRHIEFLDMARVVPCCGVWDDHDFASDDKDSTDITNGLRSEAVTTWMEYWGNNQPISLDQNLGLTTRISHGLVDIYVLDGRFFRDKGNGVCFGKFIVKALLHTIDQRGARIGRAVVLATGSNWNHHPSGDEDYGHSNYKEEREELYRELASRMGTTINGLLLLSGDDHISEIFHVELAGGRMAPEFLSSPLTRNTGLKDDPRAIVGERMASFASGGDNGKRGFATLTIDTSNRIPDGNWTAEIRYHQEAAAAQYESRSYTLLDGQFKPN
jgi:hypothetical protein